MTIKEVEEQTGLTRSNIRFYEKENLIERMLMEIHLGRNNVQIVIAFKIRPLHRLSLCKNIFMQIQQFLLPSFVCVYII